MKATIKIRFLFFGVNEDDQFALAYDEKLQKAAKAIYDGLDHSPGLKELQKTPVLLGNNIDTEEKYRKSIIKFVPFVNIIIVNFVNKILNGITQMTCDEARNLLSALPGAKTAFSEPRGEPFYEIQPSTKTACAPCGEHCHVANGTVYEKCPSISTFTPVIWVVKDTNGKLRSFQLKVEHTYINDEVFTS